MLGLNNIVFLLLCVMAGNVFAFTDNTNPQIPDMDKEEARLNELSFRLSDINETYVNLKRIHLILVENEIVSADSSSEGAAMTAWRLKVKGIIRECLTLTYDYISRASVENGPDSEDDLIDHLARLQERVVAVKNMQATQKSDFERLSNILISINTFSSRVKIFDENYLNNLTGEEYQDYIRSVNEYSERVLTSVYDLNTSMEELSINSINTVIDTLIESIQITNVIYAMGMGGLTDAVKRATGLVEYAKFIQINTTPMYQEIEMLYSYLSLGRIGKAEAEYANVVSKINILKTQFESEFVNLSPELPSDHFNHEIQELGLGYFDDINERLDTKYHQDLRTGASLAFGMKYYIRRLFRNGSSVVSACNDNVNLEAKSNLNCKVAKELSVFYQQDLTIMTPAEDALVSAGYPLNDALIDRIRLIEGKIEQMYIVDGDQ